MVSEYGIEGSLVYVLVVDLCEIINCDGYVMLWLDLVFGCDEVCLLVDLLCFCKG